MPYWPFYALLGGPSMPYLPFYALLAALLWLALFTICALLVLFPFNSLLAFLHHTGLHSLPYPHRTHSLIIRQASIKY